MGQKLTRPALAILIAIAATALTLVCFSPHYVLWRGLRVPEAWWYPEVNRAVGVLEQVEHPFATVQNQSNRGLQWRLLIPLIGYVLRLPPGAVLAIPMFGSVIVLAYIAHRVLRDGGGVMAALAATIAIAACPWFFVSTGWLGYGDSLAVLGLLLVAFASSRAVVIGACALAPFVDERFVFGLPLAVVVRIVYLDRFSAPSGDARRRDLVAILVPTLIIIAIRAVTVLMHRDPNSVGYLHERGMELGVPEMTVAKCARAAWSALRSGWGLVAIACWLGLRRNRMGGWMLVATTALTTIAAMFTSADLSRNLLVLVPAAALGAVLMQRDRWPKRATQLVTALALLNLFLPARIVVTKFENAVTGLKGELDWFENPPKEVDVRYWLDRARAESSRNELAAARHSLDNVVALEPENPDALLIAGRASLALGDRDSARQRLHHALTIAPDSWPGRAECSTLLSQLDEPATRPSTRP